MEDLNKKNGFELEKDEINKIRKDFYSESVSDKETKLIINKIYKEEKILIDPHTAVGIGAIKKLTLENNAVVLATAHPSKFFEIVQEQTNKKPELPEDLKNLLTKEEKYEILSKDLKNIKNYILQRV